jgi:hypothetical protein
MLINDWEAEDWFGQRCSKIPIGVWDCSKIG